MRQATWSVGLVALAAAQGSNAQSQSASAPEWINPFADAEAAGATDDTPQELANKRVVLEFYDAAINRKDFAAASRFLGDRYIQHNPTAKDGPEGLAAFIEFLKASYPQQRNEVKRVLTSRDYVILHVHSVQEPGTRGRVIGEVFRLEDGKVVEHWDVIHPIGEGRHPDNPNSIF